MEINWIELIGYGGTVATIATYSMKTIVPLRIAGIVGSFFFIAYASIQGIWPMLATELVILPLNMFRLYQILKLMRQISGAPDGQYIAEWLDPFSRHKRHKAGDVIFRRGDVATYLMLIRSGRFRLAEIGTVYEPGGVVGELGFVSHDHKRAMSLECIEDGEVAEVAYSDIKQLYFQNPRFGYFFLQLIGSYLGDKLQATRGELAELKSHNAAAAGSPEGESLSPIPPVAASPAAMDLTGERV